jgi:hypothetical protein
MKDAREVEQHKTKGMIDRMPLHVGYTRVTKDFSASKLAYRQDLGSWFLKFSSHQPSGFRLRALVSPLREAEGTRNLDLILLSNATQ